MLQGFYFFLEFLLPKKDKNLYKLREKKKTNIN